MQLAEAEKKARQEAIDEALVDQATADAEAKSKQEGDDEQQIKQARCEAAEGSREEQLAKNQEQISEKAEQAGKDFDSKIEEAEQVTYELKSHLAVTQDDYGTALDWLEKAKIDGLELAWAKYLAGDSEAAGAPSARARTCTWAKRRSVRAHKRAKKHRCSRPDSLKNWKRC